MHPLHKRVPQQKKYLPVNRAFLLPLLSGPLLYNVSTSTNNKQQSFFIAHPCIQQCNTV